MFNDPTRGRAYQITLTWTRDKAIFQKQNVRCDDDAEALRIATALVRFLERDGAKDANAQVLGAGQREVGIVVQDGVRVLATAGAEFQK
jgi:hypothetical protein